MKLIETVAGETQLTMTGMTILAAVIVVAFLIFAVGWLTKKAK